MYPFPFFIIIYEKVVESVSLLVTTGHIKAITVSRDIRIATDKKRREEEKFSVTIWIAFEKVSYLHRCEMFVGRGVNENTIGLHCSEHQTDGFEG